MALIDDFMPALGFATLLGKDPALRDIPYQTARADLDRLLDDALASARASSDNPHVEGALFAVCAFADEAILTSEWAGRAEWRRCPLQRARFDQLYAGEEFFARLADLSAPAPPGTPADTVPEPHGGALQQALAPAALARTRATPAPLPTAAMPARARATPPAPPAPPMTQGTLGSPQAPEDTQARSAQEAQQAFAAREVFAACLLLGFKGKYFAGPGQAELAELTRDTLIELGLEPDTALARLVPDVSLQRAVRAGPRERHRIALPLLLFGVPAALVAVAFFVASTRLSHFVEAWLQALN